MPIVRQIVTGFVYFSVLLSVVSGVLSLVQYSRADEEKIFLIFTTTPALSAIAGAIAIFVLLYDSVKARFIPNLDWAAFVLAIGTYWLSEFVLRDFVSRFPIWD